MQVTYYVYPLNQFLLYIYVFQFKPFSSLKSTLRPNYCQITAIPPPALQHHNHCSFYPQAHFLSISIIFLVFLFSHSSFNGGRHHVRVLYSSSSPSEACVCIFEAHFHLHLSSILSQFLPQYLHDCLQHFPGLFTPVPSCGQVLSDCNPVTNCPMSLFCNSVCLNPISAKN